MTAATSTTRMMRTPSCAECPGRLLHQVKPVTGRQEHTTALRRRYARQQCERASGVKPVKALDSSICLSVAQEEFAFAIALAAETYLSAKKKKELTGEDTNLLHPGIAVGVITVSAGLVSTQNDVLGRVGLLFSSIAAFAIIGKYAKRFLEAGDDPAGVEQWPGPKGVPAFGIFMSLMAFLASTQALTRV